MADEPAHVMLDANSLMHFQRPDQIDWPAMLKCQTVNLIITPVLLRELEQQKVTNRSHKLRGRAQAVVSWIATFIESEASPEVRNGVSLSFVRHTPQIDFAKHKLSHTVFDDELIATAIEYQAEHDCRVAIFTDDTGLRLKLPGHKLLPIIPPQELKLPDEPDEVEKENSRLKAELARHQNRLPKLEFSFIDGASKVALPCVIAAVNEVKPEHPPQFGTDWNDYEEYVADVAAWKREALFSTGFRVRLGNSGNGVATNVKIEMTFPDFVEAVRLREEPKMPSIFSTRWLHRDIGLPSETEPDYGDDKDTVSFSLDDLVHNRTFESDLIFLRFVSEADIQNFSAEYLITCVENLKPVCGTLHFIVEDWIASLRAH